jgi:hypothetical protein
MSIRRFCDVCDNEIGRNYVSERLKIKRGTFLAEIMISKGGTSNAGELCRDCVKAILTEGKEHK